MIFKPGDNIDDTYLVIRSKIIDNKEYVYVSFDDDKTTFLEVTTENNDVYLQNIEDDKIFEKVMYAFANEAKKYMENNE